MDVPMVYLSDTILILQEKTRTVIAQAITEMAVMSERMVYAGIYGVWAIANGSKALDRMAFHMARVVCMEPTVEFSHRNRVFRQLGKADRHGPITTRTVMAMATAMATAIDI